MKKRLSVSIMACLCLSMMGCANNEASALNQTHSVNSASATKIDSPVNQSSSPSNPVAAKLDIPIQTVQLYDTYTYYAIDKEGNLITFPNKAGDDADLNQVSKKIPGMDKVRSIVTIDKELWIIKDNGSVFLLGSNDKSLGGFSNYGTLSETPVEIKELQDIAFIHGDFGKYAAIKKNGDVIEWGDLYDGKPKQPVTEIKDLKNIVDIKGVGTDFYFIDSNRKVWNERVGYRDGGEISVKYTLLETLPPNVKQIEVGARNRAFQLTTLENELWDFSTRKITEDNYVSRIPVPKKVELPFKVKQIVRGYVLAEDGTLYLLESDTTSEPYNGGGKNYTTHYQEPVASLKDVVFIQQTAFGEGIVFFKDGSFQKNFENRELKIKFKGIENISKPFSQ